MNLQTTVGHRNSSPGEYKNPLRNNYCMDVSWNSMDDGANIHMWDCNGGKNQSFLYNPTTNQIIAESSNKCFQLDGVNEGSSIKQYTCNDNNNQKFIIDGQQIKPLSNQGLCMDVKWGGSDNGTPLHLWGCNGTMAQIFEYNPRLPSTVLKSQLRRNYCMDINGNSMDDGAKVHMWDCHGGNNQKFFYDRSNNQFKASHSNKCIGVDSIQQQQLLKQYTCDPSNNNQKFVMNANGSISPINNTNLCVDIQWGNKKNGTPLQLWECNNTPAQKWSER